MQVIEQRKPVEGDWRGLEGPHPGLVVQGIAYDVSGKFLAIHRTANVRSAKNCWALPSGCHENGYTIMEQFAIELKEEFSLNGIVSTGRYVGFYENIAREDNFHWGIVMVTMQVENPASLKNNEIEKHDSWKWIPVVDLTLDNSPVWKVKWAPTLGDALKKMGCDIHKSVHKTLYPHS